MALALYVVLPAVGGACGFVGTFAGSASLGALWLVLGPLAGAGISGRLAQRAGRDAMRTMSTALSVAVLMVVAALGALFLYTLGKLPIGFAGS